MNQQRRDALATSHPTVQVSHPDLLDLDDAALYIAIGRFVAQQELAGPEFEDLVEQKLDTLWSAVRSDRARAGLSDE